MIGRRHMLAGGLAAGFLSACTTPADRFSYVDISGPEVRAAEAARNPGRIIQNRLHAAVSQIDLAGKTTPAWCYNGKLPCPVIRPGRTLSALFDTDNPGLWMIHCHNVYHAEAGMMTMIGYQRKG